jgi:hypothetical protein
MEGGVPLQQVSGKNDNDILGSFEPFRSRRTRGARISVRLHSTVVLKLLFLFGEVLLELAGTHSDTDSGPTGVSQAKRLKRPNKLVVALAEFRKGGFVFGRGSSSGPWTPRDVSDSFCWACWKDVQPGSSILDQLRDTS